MSRGVFTERGAKISKALKGRTIPEERKKRISETLKRKYRSGDILFLRRTVSEETKKRIAEKNKGKTRTEETKERMRQNSARYWKGKKRSPETIAKITETKRLNKLARDQAEKDMKFAGCSIIKSLKSAIGLKRK